VLAANAPCQHSAQQRARTSLFNSSCKTRTWMQFRPRATSGRGFALVRASRTAPGPATVTPLSGCWWRVWFESLGGELTSPRRFSRSWAIYRLRKSFLDLSRAAITIQSQQLKWAKVAKVTSDPLWSIGSTSSVPVPRQRRSKKPLQLRITSCNASGATGSARDDSRAIIGILSACQEETINLMSRSLLLQASRHAMCQH
jgi:hypothetical protein